MGYVPQTVNTGQDGVHPNGNCGRPAADAGNKLMVLARKLSGRISRVISCISFVLVVQNDKGVKTDSDS